MRYLVFILVLFSVALAAPPQIVLNDFTGGLDTKTNPLNLQPKFATICTNIDLSRNGGAISPRKGYLNLLPGQDSVWGNAPTIGIFAFRRADGVRRICGITSQPGDTSLNYWANDSPTLNDSSNCVGGQGAACDSITRADTDSSGYGYFLASPGLPAIPPGSGSMYYLQDVASRVLYEYVYQGVTPHWTYWNDRAYMTNGRQRPLVFHPYNEFGRDGYVRELVPLTPGEPLIIPLDVDGNLNGEYFYMIGHSGSCGEALGDDKIKNGSGDFEAWTGNLPDDWDTLANTTGFIAEETHVDSVLVGNSALRLTTPTSSGFFPKGVNITIETDADSAWVVSAWIHKTTRGGSFGIHVKDTINGTFLNGINIFDSTGEYVNYEIDVIPRSDRDSIELYLQFNFGLNDTVYVDSVTVRATETKRFAVVTKPVVANNENVFLTHFPWQTIVAGCAFDDAAYDVMDLNIYRTKANPGKIDANDKFWLIDTKSFTDKIEIDTFTYIDTLPDDSLGSGSWITSITIDTLAIGRDESRVLTGVRVGAPTYVDSAQFDGNMFSTDLSANETFIKTSYICTYFDSLINAESDSSRSLHIFRDQTNDTSGYKIGLPPLPGGKTRLTRRLYKSYQYSTTIPKDSVTRVVDTTFIVDWSMRKVAETQNEHRNQGVSDFYTAIRKIEFILQDETGVLISPPYNKWQADLGDHIIKYRVKFKRIVPHPNTDSVKVDTTTTIYRHLDEIKGSDSIYVDTIGFDSIIKAKAYANLEAPFDLKYITSFQDRLWGSSGSRLYWTYLDTGSSWGSYRNVLLDDDDGDEITAILPMRDYVRVFKNYSQYIVFPGNEFEYERRETIEQLGCIASHSALAYQNGVFYLSHQGVIREQGSDFRDKGSSFGKISEPINNILMNRTTEALRNIVFKVHKEQLRVSIPDSDTTFVYDLINGAWYIWSYAFAQAIPYDTLTANSKNRSPSSELVFITGEDDIHYKADTTSFDDVDSIQIHYRTAPLLISEAFHEISQIGLFIESNDTAYLNIKLYDAEGDSVWHHGIDTLIRRYENHGVLVDGSHYFQLDITDSISNATWFTDSLAIQRISIWVNRKEGLDIE